MLKRNKNIVLKFNNQISNFVLYGLQQSGKTTFLKQLADANRKYADLADPALRSMANEEPVLFLQRYSPPVLIDNIQYAPELVPVIKDYVLHNGKPGDFWLIAPKEYSEGLCSIFAELGDKFVSLELRGISNAELEGRESTPFIPEWDSLFKAAKQAKPISITEIYRRIWRGDKPALIDNEVNWQSYYAKLVQDILQCDIRSFVQLNDELKFYRFLCAAASQTGQLLNYAAMAKEADISLPTAKQWLLILERLGIVYLLQPCLVPEIKYAVKTPKLYFTDTGLAAYLLKWNTAEALEFGAMSTEFFETWVINEVYKSYSNNGQKRRYFITAILTGRKLNC